MTINQVVTDSELQDLKQRYRFDRTVTRILEALECERSERGHKQKIDNVNLRIACAEAGSVFAFKRLFAVESEVRELLDNVMNIRGDSEKLWVAGYRNGHRDARHAAAELVNACLVKLDPTPASAGAAGEHVG